MSPVLESERCQVPHPGNKPHFAAIPISAEYRIGLSIAIDTVVAGQAGTRTERERQPADKLGTQQPAAVGARRPNVRRV